MLVTFLLNQTIYTL